jgi:hypothetical protein
MAALHSKVHVSVLKKFYLNVCVCTRSSYSIAQTSRAYVPLATVVGVGAYHTQIRSDWYENMPDYKI